MWYFGYGSNMSDRSLRLKDVHPLSSEPAVAEDWRLVFDLAPLMAHEGHFANIAPRADGRAVHGVLHRLDEGGAAAMDRMEGEGINYQRRLIPVRTYSGERIEAEAYVSLSESSPGRPTRRYLNLLVQGATHAGIAADYLEWLCATEIEPVTDPGRFPMSRVPDRRYRRAEIRNDPSVTAVGGVVIGLEGAPEFFRRLLGRRVIDVFVLQRLDTSDGNETLEDVAQGRLTPEQQAHLNRHVHDLADIGTVLGRYEFTDE